MVFGPVLVLWFFTMTVFGLWRIGQEPRVLWALSPHHALAFFWHNGWHGFLALGTVFLAVTGGEALYADIGHFGKRPIRLTWFALVLPALVINYFGQGAVLLRDPTAAENPFYRMAPNWRSIPLCSSPPQRRSSLRRRSSPARTRSRCRRSNWAIARG